MTGQAKRKRSARRGESVADLRKQIARQDGELRHRTVELEELLELQRATNDVLKVISRSTFDLQSVLTTVAETAARLCEAEMVFVARRDEDGLRYVATVGSNPKTTADAIEFQTTYLDLHPISARPGREPITGRVILERRAVQIADITADTEYRFPEAFHFAKIRTLLGVPLLRDGELIGQLNLARQRVLPFTDRQIEVAQTFADQAVIATENARLLGELRRRTEDLQESLEYQTATSDVFKVISQSTFDLEPVLDTLVETAARICGAESGFIFRLRDDLCRMLASFGSTAEYREFQEHNPIPLTRATLAGRTALERRVVHIADAATDPEYTRVEAMRLGKQRSMLGAPLIREDKLIGVMTLARAHVEPFTDKQIELVRTFADQAVIAIENTRLVTELRESLEQQEAIAQVLGVINSSPADLTPVFNALLDKATRLCEAGFGILWTYDGERFQAAALHGVPEPFAEFLATPVRLADSAALAEIATGHSYVHVADLAASESHQDSALRRATVDLGGGRTGLAVPLLKDRTVLGIFVIYRQEVRPFTEKQIALLQNFAAQAVIAMDNARLITETREALEQQTATAEVLQVINSSPGDLKPVFEAMLQKTMRLCEAAFGILQVRDGSDFRTAALHGVPPALAEFLLRTPRDVGKGTAVRRMLDGDDFVQFEDIATQARQSGDARQRAFAELGGARTYVAIGLRRDEVLLGTIAVYRQEVRPFTENQIALLQNFAAQAVIAMENARLLTETRDALAQQTATAEVLGVINSSPGDLAPVFHSMLGKALSLCEATFGFLTTYDGQLFRAAAQRGVPSKLAEYFAAGVDEPRPGDAHWRLLAGEDVVHNLDQMDEDAYRSGNPLRRAVVDLGGARTVVTVALRKDGKLLGSIAAYRQEVRSFTDKQIALLQNFAAQAVIAMENARLITETREALEQQTATAEVLQVINSSPGDLAPVFDAMLERAMNLCEADFGGLWTDESGLFGAVALRGVPAPYSEFYARNPPGFGPGTGPALIQAGRSLAHITDMADTDAYRTGEPNRRALVDLGGARTALVVALPKDDALLGFIMIYRKEVRPFSEKQIALLQNFAAQTVIAMENARLITETREALEQQTATAEVLQVINASPGDLTPVFDAMLEKACRLCEAAYGMLYSYEDNTYRTMAVHNLPPAYAESLQGAIVAGKRNALGRLASGERIVHIADLRDDEAYRTRDPLRVASVELGGARTYVVVPLLKDDVMVGAIAAYRQEVRRFSDKQIALLQNFAAQAVIATENARLLDEIRQRQAELRVTFDNMGDGVVMFDEHLRLAAWNRNFQEMLDLPDALLSERPSYSDYLRILAERGEFGTVDIETEIARRLENTDQEFRQERTRPDGRVIEVRRNAVPDGGFVLIYSDITERKRSEAEIRAARDAAEAAYRDLKAAQANLVQAEKMASLGQLTAGIAHEIKNPLNFVNNFAGLSVELLGELKETAAPALSALPKQDRTEIDDTIDMLTSNLEKIAEHGRRADGIVKSMLEHSRGSTGERRFVDLNALIEEALNLAYHGGRAQDQSFNITLERDYDRDIAPIELVPQDITRVCLNLFGNGFYATTKRQREGTNREFKPTLKVSTRDLGDVVEIRTRDNGIGIPREIKDKLFQPFFTTKPTGEGTGLGLSISYDIVTQEHGGTIEVDSEVGKFTEFTIRLPRH